MTPGRSLSPTEEEAVTLAAIRAAELDRAEEIGRLARAVAEAEQWAQKCKDASDPSRPENKPTTPRIRAVRVAREGG